MKAPTKVVFTFDPDKSDIPALANRAGRIIWACIKYQHIVSQYFDGNVQNVALRIAEIKPKDYLQFKSIIISSGLNIFGTIGDMNLHRLDDEFWQGVWKYVQGRKELEIEVKINDSIKE